MQLQHVLQVAICGLCHEALNACGVENTRYIQQGYIQHRIRRPEAVTIAFLGNQLLVCIDNRERGSGRNCHILSSTGSLRHEQR